MIDGYWTYHINEMIKELQETYHQLKQEVENNYGVTLQKNRINIGFLVMKIDLTKKST